jgi:hypothetical protein
MDIVEEGIPSILTLVVFQCDIERLLGDHNKHTVVFSSKLVILNSHMSLSLSRLPCL